MCIHCQQEDLVKKARWNFYNLAFCVFGNTRLWPYLGVILWR